LRPEVYHRSHLQEAELVRRQECIVLYYSETSLVASHIRDEIRAIETGFYLGKVYWDNARLIDFSLDFRA